jgi:hypothetical protein
MKVTKAIAFDFEVELDRVVRRAERLRDALAGTADINEVHVVAHKVRAHDRAAHVRYVITRRRAK